MVFVHISEEVFVGFRIEIRSKYVLYGYVQISTFRVFKGKTLKLIREVYFLISLIHMDIRIFHFKHFQITYIKHTQGAKISLIS